MIRTNREVQKNRSHFDSRAACACHSLLGCAASILSYSMSSSDSSWAVRFLLQMADRMDAAHEIMDNFEAAPEPQHDPDAIGGDINDPDGDVNDPDAVGDSNDPNAVGDDTYDPDAAGDINDPDAVGDSLADPDAAGDINDPDAVADDSHDPDAVGDDTHVGAYLRIAGSSSSNDGCADDPGSGSETVVDNVNTTKCIAGIIVVTLDRSVTEEEVREALISRVRDRGSIRSLHESDDELYFRMATPAQANRVVHKMNGITMNALGVMIRLHQKNTHTHHK